jgi:hypothetical protein
MMKIKYLYTLFIRDDNGVPQNQQRGFIAGLVPEFPIDSKMFIVCKVDPAILTEVDLTDDTICLDLATLCKKFPNSTKEVELEDGSMFPVAVFGYFDVKGRSSEEECPIITFADCLPRGVA